jgi:8-oxo-dGTP pyrophosphatase MutT (NUDIX family)
MRDLFPVVVHTLLFRRGSVLLLRRARTGYLDGLYALPGGHLQRGESVVACAIRECFEETGIALDAARLRPAAVLPYRSAEHQGIDFIMVCDDVVGEPRLAEPDRFDDLGWWPVDALPPDTVPYVEPAIAMTRCGEWFLEFEG